MKYLSIIVLALLWACTGSQRKPIKHKRWIGDVYIDQRQRKLVILVADKPGNQRTVRTYTVDIAAAINQARADSVDFSQLTYPCDRGDFLYISDSTEETDIEKLKK